MVKCQFTSFQGFQLSSVVLSKSFFLMNVRCHLIVWHGSFAFQSFLDQLVTPKLAQLQNLANILTGNFCVFEILLVFSFTSPAWSNSQKHPMGWIAPKIAFALANTRSFSLTSPSLLSVSSLKIVNRSLSVNTTSKVFASCVCRVSCPDKSLPLKHHETVPYLLYFSDVWEASFISSRFMQLHKSINVMMRN